MKPITGVGDHFFLFLIKPRQMIVKPWFLLIYDYAKITDALCKWKPICVHSGAV